jgi:hypothetical protein
MKPSLGITLAVALAAPATTSFAQPRTGASASSQDNRDRIVCRRFTRIGSLVDSYRTCKTNREWAREHENLQHLSATDSCRDRANGGALCNP